MSIPKFIFRCVRLMGEKKKKKKYQRAGNNYERSMYKSQVGYLRILAKETGKPARQRLSSLV